jgi:hypothetical protein
MFAKNLMKDASPRRGRVKLWEATGYLFKSLKFEYPSGTFE